ncbi:MAG: NADH-quinone oxidoreductase subunit L [Spirochaetia bacterium]|nr:NADH-quinone oxidoreductase subunit L [Spirochaetia bacterium]
MNWGLLLIPLLPALAAALISVGGRRLGLLGSCLVASAATAASLALAVMIGFQGVIAGNVQSLGHIESAVFPTFNFVSFGEDWHAAAGFRMDLLSGMMTLLITLFGFLILLFSYDYMKEDPDPVRYFAGISLFISAMLVLVLSENLVLLFLGWEGVGLCSYLLIGHYWRESGVPLAAFRAFFVNRIGDLFFIVGVFFLMRALGTVSFAEMPEKFSTMSGAMLPETRSDLVWASFLLLGGAFGKSAQVPLHVWLPDAMAGPTPVSALIHAATMVTAGVFLIARLDWLYSAMPAARGLLLVAGLLTLIVGALLACFQNDIKKVLAYSTLSHLGLMFTALAAGASSSALFHLFGHAAFKAISFLAAGSIILASHHEQDLRNLRGCLKYLPVTRVALWIGAIGGAGVLPYASAGFFSKESVLHSISHGSFLIGSMSIPGSLIHGIVFIVELLGVLYLFRMLALLETGKSEHTFHEHGLLLKFVLIVLSVLAIAFGVSSAPGIPGIQSLLFANVQHIEVLEIAIASGSAIIVAVVVFVLYSKDSVENLTERIASTSPFSRLFYFDSIYTALLIKPLNVLGATTGVWLEHPLFMGVIHGAGNLADRLGGRFSRLQTGLINDYAIMILVSGAILILFALLA